MYDLMLTALDFPVMLDGSFNSVILIHLGE
jgi:hypothetical protein